MKLRLSIAIFLLAACAPLNAQQIEVESVLLSLVEQLEIPAREAGVLSTLAVTEGQLVKEGALLAQIDDTESRLRKNRAEIELDKTRDEAKNDIKVRYSRKSHEVAIADLRRAADSLKKFSSSVSESEVDRLRLATEKAALEIEQSQHDFQLAQHTFKIGENEIKLADNKIERHRIISPVTGIVVQVKRHRGEWVEPGQSVLRILRINPLRAEGFIDAKHLKDDLAGRRATLKITLPGKSQTEFPGKIVFISPEVNPVNDQVRIWAEIDNTNFWLRPGLRGSLLIEPTRK